MDRQGKQKLKTLVKGRMEKANSAFLAEFRGMAVSELTDLRRLLRGLNAEFRVSKNRVAIKAVQDGVNKFEALTEQLKGPVGVIYLYGDVAATAKAVLKFEAEHEKFKVKSGVLDAKLLSTGQIKVLGDLPSREELLARIVGTMVAPHRGILLVLNGVSSKLVRVIAAIRDQKK